MGDRVLLRVLEGRSHRDMIGPMTQAVRLLRWEVCHRTLASLEGSRETHSVGTHDAKDPVTMPLILVQRTKTDVMIGKVDFFQCPCDEFMRCHLTCASVVFVSQDCERVIEDEAGQKEQLDCSGPREVPFIAQYRKELVRFPDVLNMHDLWLIKEWDEKVSLSCSCLSAHELTRLFFEPSLQPLHHQ